MKKTILLIALSIFAFHTAFAQQVIDLWSSSDAPITNDITDQARLYIYQPELRDTIKSSPVLVLPGGGYAQVSMPNEGHALAKWLASEGFTAIVLKYRLPNALKEIPFDDVEEALKIIADNADKLNINLDKFGIAGSSAGAHLAALFSNWVVNQSELIQPKFNILFYPVISFEQLTKGGTRNNLLGLNPSAELIRKYSVQLQVSERTPQTIIFVSDNDDSVSSINSIKYYEALKDNKVPAALYVFPTGGHGWAMQKSFEYNNLALSLLSKWLISFR